MHFHEWKLLNFRLNFTEICFLGSNWQYGSIDSDNGLVPNRHQAIIWSSVGMLCWCIYASLGLHEWVAWWNMFYYQHGVDKILFECHVVYNFKQWLFCLYICICIHMCICICICLSKVYPVGRFNVKMPSYQYRDSHYKDDIAVFSL